MNYAGITSAIIHTITQLFIHSLIIVFLLFSSSVEAESIFCVPACNENNSNLGQVSNLSKNLSCPERLKKINNEIKILNNTSEIALKEKAYHLRQISKTDDGRTEEKSKTFLSTFSDDINALSEVISSIASYQRAYPKIDPAGRAQVETKIQILQKAKLGILLRQPLLANEKIKKFLMLKAEADDFSAIPPNKIKSLLIELLSDDVQLLMKEQDKFSEFLLDKNQPIISRNADGDLKNCNLYLEKIPKNFEYVTEKLLIYNSAKVKILSSEDKSELCEFEKVVGASKKWKDRLKFIGDATAVGVTFAAGPIGRSLALAAMAGRARLIEWGVAASGETYLAASSYAEYDSLISTCNSAYLHYSYSPSGEQLSELNKCQDNLSDQLIKSSLSVAAGGMPLLSKLLRSVVTLNRTGEIIRVDANASSVANMVNQGKAVRYSKTGSEYTVFNAGSGGNSRNVKLNQLSDDYLNFVAEEYKRRLNLSEQEVDSFIKTSREFKDRTTYVISTSKIHSVDSPSAGLSAVKSNDGIQGGIGIVTSQKPTDLLPLEKATGIKIDRSNGGVAEIVRLTTKKESPREVVDELMGRATDLLVTNPLLNTVYIYTSRVHARLYKRLGIFVKEERELPGGRDVLLRIDVSELRRLRNAG